MKIRKWLGSFSLRIKIIIMMLLIGILPAGVLLFASIRNIQKQYTGQQLASISKGFEQVQMALEDKMQSVHNVSTLLGVSDIYGTCGSFSDSTEDISKQLEDFGRINEYSYGMEMAFGSCDISYFIDNDFKVVNSVSSRFHPISDIEDQQWYIDLKNSGGEATWIYMEQEAYKGKSFALARILWSNEDFNTPVGVLLISLKNDAISELLVNAKAGQIIFVEDSEGHIILENSRSKLPAEVIKNADYSGKFYRISLNNENYYFRSEKLGDSEVYISSLVPIKDIEAQNRTMVIRTTIIYAAIAFFILLLLFPLVRMITNRITVLSNEMGRIKDGLIQKIPDDTDNNDEISLLIAHYNTMVDKVEESLREQYALGEEKKGAELKALQSQINPHFLYNTLDMINWMAMKNESENIREVIQAMSKFYRLTLSKGKNIITIGEELIMCESYMDIQKKRFKGRINFIVDVEDEVLQYAIPKITLQPFVENAIIHGINELPEAKGTIRIDGFMEDGRIQLSVSDDGAGMDKDSMYQGKGSHYGMKNIKKRLDMYYQEEIEIGIESKLGCGTCIMINIPATIEEDQE